MDGGGHGAMEQCAKLRGGVVAGGGGGGVLSGFTGGVPEEFGADIGDDDVL
jgi:hypothetical protein